MTGPSYPIGAATLEPSWVARTLVALLVAAHVLVVGGLSLAGATALLGARADAVWALVVASAAVALSVRPAYRWIREAVVDLLSDADKLVAPPFAGMERHVTEEPAELLAAMAATVGAVLSATAVQIEVWPAAPKPAVGAGWAAGATVTTGSLTEMPLEMPLVNAGRAYGALRVLPRSRRRPNAATSELLAGLARHVGLVVSSAVLREELAASRERLVLAREEERRRIRRDLHDGLGPDLAAIKLQLGASRRQLAPLGVDLSGFDELRAMVGEATDEVRRVVEDLRPPLLDDCGLVDALRSLRFVPPTLCLRVEAPSPLPVLPAAVEVALYRIGAEAVRNTVRHAGASTCTVAIGVEPGRATLMVADDGVGVGPSDRPGVGTAAMTERAEELGGSVTIDAIPGGGTLVAAAIPLRAGDAA